MVKLMIYVGATIAAIGVGSLFFFVMPHVGAPQLAGLDGISANTIPPLALFIAALGIAIGFAMIGVAVGHWWHPRPSHSHSPNQHGDEV